MLSLLFHTLQWLSMEHTALMLNSPYLTTHSFVSSLPFTQQAIHCWTLPGLQNTFQQAWQFLETALHWTKHNTNENCPLHTKTFITHNFNTYLHLTVHYISNKIKCTLIHSKTVYCTGWFTCEELTSTIRDTCSEEHVSCANCTDGSHFFIFVFIFFSFFLCIAVHCSAL